MSVTVKSMVTVRLVTVMSVTVTVMLSTVTPAVC